MGAYPSPQCSARRLTDARERLLDVQQSIFGSGFVVFHAKHYKKVAACLFRKDPVQGRRPVHWYVWLSADRLRRYAGG